MTRIEELLTVFTETIERMIQEHGYDRGEALHKLAVWAPATLLDLMKQEPPEGEPSGPSN